MNDFGFFRTTRRRARSVRTALLITTAASCPIGGLHAHGGAHPGAAGALATGPTTSVASRPRAAPPTKAGPAHETGTWSEPVEWPVLAVHAALLPTGDVLAWDATPDDFDDDPHTAENATTRVTLWDPDTGTHRAIWNEGGGDLFCAGSAHLWDGRVLFAGGDSGRSGRNGPLANSNVFDPWSGTWSETDHLNAPRWYSSVAALPDATMLTFGGTYSPRPIGEVFELNARWRALPVTVPFTVSGDYAWLQSTSDGDVAYLGPDAQLGTLSTDGDGTWSSLGTRDADGYRSYGSYALYDVDRALVAGGGDSLASATVLDLSTGTSAPTAPMRHGRRQHDLTILADGRVLASGGNASGARFVDLEAGVRAAEVWDPATGAWTEVATLPSERQYHSTTLLLPDGTVLSAGGGYCAPCGDVGYHAQSAEIWTPPYLYARPGDGAPARTDGVPALADRPAVTDAPARIDWAVPFEVVTPDAAAVERVHLIKLGSVTHSQNQDQRLVPLDFRAVGGTLVVDGPANRRVAPPGHYLLFLVDDRGVPSIAPIVQVGQPLLRAGDVVVDAVRDRAGRATANLYEVNGSGAHTLRVRLRGDAALVDLRASARDAGGIAREVALACTAAPAAQRGRLCTADASGDTRWLLSVDGVAGTDYELLAGVRPGSVPAAMPGFGNAAGAPASPVRVRVRDLSHDTIELAWDAPSDGASVAGYEIHRDGRLTSFQPGTALRAGTLRSATAYTWRIVAVDTTGNRSAPSAALVATTLPYDGPDADTLYHPAIPSAPTGLRVVAYSDTSAEVFWDPSFDDGHIVGYEVYRDARLVATLDATSWYDDAFSAAAGHVYAVVAIDDDGQRSTDARDGDDLAGSGEHGTTGAAPAPGPGSEAGPPEVIAAPSATPARRASGGGLVSWLLPVLALVGLGRRPGGAVRRRDGADPTRTPATCPRGTGAPWTDPRSGASSGPAPRGGCPRAWR